MFLLREVHWKGNLSNLYSFFLEHSSLSAEESESDSEELDVSGSDGDDTSWISWFCNLRGNDSQVPYYDYTLDLILDIKSSHDKAYLQRILARELLWFCSLLDDMFTEEQNELVESAVEMLYGLIHVRYVLTSKGMSAMLSANLFLIIPSYIDYDFAGCIFSSFLREFTSSFSSYAFCINTFSSYQSAFSMMVGFYANQLLIFSHITPLPSFSPVFLE
ncbi:hypothetical protein K2173_005655 [Erythroxylum novogranatense]|uniref:Casein kinase II subunit beta n=1 Tax=Erythroxylum novogranatense TaxID=1862640 RepID=A0AAV8SR91_9ROSI|nr:hypothetical protein K2173_005655 [Erythroxylum novogranatense]